MKGPILLIVIWLLVGLFIGALAHGIMSAREAQAVFAGAVYSADDDPLAAVAWRMDLPSEASPIERLELVRGGAPDQATGYLWPRGASGPVAFELRDGRIAEIHTDTGDRMVFAPAEGGRVQATMHPVGSEPFAVTIDEPPRVAAFAGLRPPSQRSAWAPRLPANLLIGEAHAKASANPVPEQIIVTRRVGVPVQVVGGVDDTATVSIECSEPLACRARSGEHRTGSTRRPRQGVVSYRDVVVTASLATPELSAVEMGLLRNGHDEYLGEHGGVQAHIENVGWAIAGPATALASCVAVSYFVPMAFPWCASVGAEQLGAWATITGTATALSVAYTENHLNHSAWQHVLQEKFSEQVAEALRDVTMQVCAQEEGGRKVCRKVVLSSLHTWKPDNSLPTTIVIDLAASKQDEAPVPPTPPAPANDGALICPGDRVTIWFGAGDQRHSVSARLAREASQKHGHNFDYCSYRGESGSGVRPFGLLSAAAELQDSCDRSAEGAIVGGGNLWSSTQRRVRITHNGLTGTLDEGQAKAWVQRLVAAGRGAPCR